MNFRLSACLPLALALMSIMHAGIVRAAAPADAPAANAGLPDACKLMTQADVAALFKGMPVKNFSKQLSPVYRGPQFVSICGYSVKLPAARLPKFASLVISQCGVCDKSRTPGSLKGAPDGEAAVAGNQVKILSHVGDEAFEVFSTTLNEFKLYVRKDDLTFILTLDKASEKSESHAVALATQAAKRWRGGVGVVEAATPIDTKAVVEAVPYTPPPPRAAAPAAATAGTSPPASLATRPQTSVSQDKWPDPCKLLTLADIRAVFGDMTIDPQQKAVPIQMPDNIPAPLPCDYTAHKNVTVNGKRSFVLNSVRLTVFDMATTVELAKKYYRLSHGDTPLPGLGEEASIDAMNHIYIRKGVLNVELRIGGDARDRALFEDARTRLNALAKRVAANLP